jgi:AraC-like DNA-binding protein
MKVLCCDSLDQWREQYMPLLAKMDFEPYNGTPLKAMFHLPLGLPGVVRGRFSAGVFFRTPAQAKTEQDAFQIAAVEVGQVHAEFRCQQLRVRRGEATVNHVAEPFRWGSSTLFGGMNVIVPRVDLEARDVRPDAAAMQHLSQQCETLRLLKIYVRWVEKSGLDHDTFGAPTALRALVQQHVHDLAALALSWRGAVGESSLDAVADARLRAALGYIAEHFHDPQLTVEEVARHQGVSARYLQRLLHSTDRSFTRAVNELRLQNAFTALTAEAPDKRSVLDIALQAGYSSLSYFNRLFRARYGDTPGGVRASGRR